MAQSVHGITQFATEFPDEFKEWTTTSNVVCCLEASVPKIELLIGHLKALRIKHVQFNEPDINNESTCIGAIVDTGQHKLLFNKLKLANANRN